MHYFLRSFRLAPASCLTWLATCLLSFLVLGLIKPASAQLNYVQLHSFTESVSAPEATLVLGSDGNFYGTASEGGPYGDGAVFKVTPSGTETTLATFDGANGALPVAALVQGSDGNFYGTTESGGSSGDGTVFKITPSGTLTVLHSFDSTHGAHPEAALVQGSDGNFYGTTKDGGSASDGTVFKITPSGTLSVLHSFGDGTVTNDGVSSTAALIQGSDGNFYGTTAAGGSESAGTVFEITPSGTLSVLHSFGDGSVANDGANPFAALVQGSDGSFYGTTQYGGTSDNGTVFKITPVGTLTLSYSFSDLNDQNDNSDGVFPSVALVLGSDGSFYGTTSAGGSDGQGTVFKITASGTETTLYTFDLYVINTGFDADDDSVSPSALVLGNDGNFYGTTPYGGASSLYGTVFKITPSGTETTLYSFPNPDGQLPTAALVQGSDGSFYGTTAEGGDVAGGTAFKVSSAGTVTTLAGFLGTNATVSGLILEGRTVLRSSETWHDVLAL